MTETRWIEELVSRVNGDSCMWIPGLIERISLKEGWNPNTQPRDRGGRFRKEGAAGKPELNRPTSGQSGTAVMPDPGVNNWVDSVKNSPVLVDTVKSYTEAAGYEKVNGRIGLRGMRGDLETMEKFYPEGVKLVRKMDEVVSMAPKLGEEQVFWRGSDKKYVPESGEVFDHGFVSVTTSLKHAKDYVGLVGILKLGGEGVLIKVIVPGGAKAVPLDEIHSQGLDEYVLPRGQNYEVSGRGEIDGMPFVELRTKL